MKNPRLYSVHLNPKDPAPYEKAVFIPDSFSWYAFLFQFVWAFYHRLWIPAVIFFCLNVGASLVGYHAGLESSSIMVLKIGIAAMIGLSANDLWRDSLEKRGWIVSDVVIASSTLEASRRYFDRYLGHIESSLAGEEPRAPLVPHPVAVPPGGSLAGPQAANPAPASWSSGGNPAVP